MGKKNKKIKLAAPAPGVGDEFFEFEGANIHPSAAEPEKKPTVFSKKSSKKPSPYTKREVILPSNDAATSSDTMVTDITRDDLRARARGRTSVPEALLADALKRKHGIHRAEPEKENIVTRIIDRFRTKTVSGVKIVGAKNIIVTKVTDEQLKSKGDGHEAAIAENLAMMEEMDDDDLGIL